MEQRERKNVVMGMLLAAICIMAVGYAALAQQLTINGTATITSTWDVEITNIAEVSGSKVGDAKVVNKNSDGTTASFDVELTNPGDEVKLAITVSNNGTLKAYLDSMSIDYFDKNDNNVTSSVTAADPIQYTVTGVTAGDASTSTTTKLAAKNASTNTPGTNVVYVTVKYNEDIETQPAEDLLARKITVTLNYKQDLTPAA